MVFRTEIPMVPHELMMGFMFCCVVLVCQSYLLLHFIKWGSWWRAVNIFVMTASGALGFSIAIYDIVLRRGWLV